MVLLMNLKVFCQLTNAFGKQSNLNLGRARIQFVQLMLGDDLPLLVCGQCHRLITSSIKDRDTMAAAWICCYGESPSRTEFRHQASTQLFRCKAIIVHKAFHSRIFQGALGKLSEAFEGLDTVAFQLSGESVHRVELPFGSEVSVAVHPKVLSVNIVVKIEDMHLNLFCAFT